MTETADVGLVLEGTYPYVPGGVSAWVHELIRSLPERRFVIVHISPERGTYRKRRYELPENVEALSDLYCREPLPQESEIAALRRAVRRERWRLRRAPRSSRVLHALRRLHLEDTVDDALMDDLASADLTVGGFLHGDDAFELVVEIYQQLAPAAPFVDFFWHFRSMHLPILRLLRAEPPAASLFHALSTGYAGLLAALWSRRTGRPLLLTEHGIYTRERLMELRRADWFRRKAGDGRRAPEDARATSSLSTVWAHFFRALAACAYHQARSIVSLSDGSREKQIADGAPAQKTLVVPNGIELKTLPGVFSLGGRVPLPRPRSAGTPLRVAFVGRVVPIKDVVTFIRACDLALRHIPLEVRIIGPVGESPAYARRCLRLVRELRRQGSIRFEGSQPASRIYKEVDLVVLTSFSEGQPLVILEANAAGIPVIATDVGSCRDLICGRGHADRSIGPSGIVTGLEAPGETAAAIIRLARDPGLRRKMGEAGRERVARSYRQRATIASYQALYAGVGEPWLASAGS